MYGKRRCSPSSKGYHGPGQTNDDIYTKHHNVNIWLYNNSQTSPRLLRKWKCLQKLPKWLMCSSRNLQQLPNDMFSQPKNRGTVSHQITILIGFPIINHLFWGFSPYFWKHPYLGQVRKIHLPRNAFECFGELSDTKYFFGGAEFISLLWVGKI